ncbi:NUDIX hydrolase [Streptomyces sp. NPDC006692]|uniref:NUDIX hydrolase n=1 Tax=unclassified Streptomyces TaxID=2593676 RepID=UPI0036C78F23
MSTAGRTVLAAGCVLWRRSPWGDGVPRAPDPVRDGRGPVRDARGSGRDGLGPVRHALDPVRVWEADAVEICLVHRPKYDDWSHPKGKLKRGEAPLAGALREVLEETGFACVPGARLPTAHYTDAQGRPKRVDYWAAEAGEGHFTANAEVDRLLWLPPAAAHHRLTQPRDRQLLLALLDALHSA